MLGKPEQHAVAQAALTDSDAWVRAAASSALTAVDADIDEMFPLYETMIRSNDKEPRAEGVKKAGELHRKRVDITALVPALMDVFRKPIYDANFSSQTRAPALTITGGRCLSPEALRLFQAGNNTLAVYITSCRGHLHDFDFGIEVL